MPLILLIIGFILIIYNYRAIKKENKINQENDGLNISFQSVLQDSKEELNDYKMEIGLLRKDMAESLTELQEEIFEIKNNLNRLKKNEIIYENKENLESSYFLSEYDIDANINNHDKNKEDGGKAEEVDALEETLDVNEASMDSVENLEIEDGVISEINFSEKVDSTKTQNIKKLLEEGLTEEEICHELSVSKGEVILVKGLFKK